MNAFAAPIFCLVTNRHRASPDARTPDAAIAGLEARLDEAIAAGVDLIQLRERGLETRTLRALAVRIAGRARGTATRVLVNDRVDVAAAAGSGVHLRGDAPDAQRVRPLLAPGAVVTRAAHACVEVGEIARSVDAVLFGTVLATVSKPGGEPAGVDALGAAARAGGGTPVLGIGGLGWGDVEAVAAAGAAGIAGIGLFLPEAAGGPSDLRRTIEAARARWRAVL